MKLKTLFTVAFAFTVATFSALSHLNNDFAKRQTGEPEENSKVTLDSVEVYFVLGLTHIKSGSHQHAIEAFQKAISLKPDYLEIVRNIPRLLQSLGLYYRASEVYHDLSIAYVNQDRYQEAIWACRNVSNAKPELQEPDSTIKYNDLHDKYMSEGRYEEAREALEHAIRIMQDYAPDSAKQFCDLCITYNKKGQFKEAVEACRQALRIKADYGWAYVNLGRAFNGLNRYEEAISVCKAAIMVTKTYYADAYCVMGMSYGNLGKFDDELWAYRYAIANRPNYAEVRYYLCLEYLNRNDKTLALEQYNALKILDKDLAGKLSIFIEK